MGLSPSTTPLIHYVRIEHGWYSVLTPSCFESVREPFGIPRQKSSSFQPLHILESPLLSLFQTTISWLFQTLISSISPSRMTQKCEALFIRIVSIILSDSNGNARRRMLRWLPHPSLPLPLFQDQSLVPRAVCVPGGEGGSVPDAQQVPWEIVRVRGRMESVIPRLNLNGAPTDLAFEIEFESVCQWGFRAAVTPWSENKRKP